MIFHVVIPARFASSRLPGKPLLDLAGQSMIQRVYRSASRSKAQTVTVATDDQRIYDAVVAFGGTACMTSDQHESGTDRLQEVAAKRGWADHDLVVNVQGDEPLIPAEVINQVAVNLACHSAASAATLSEPLADVAQCFDPNVVKVVSDSQNMALYFSRAAIPWLRGSFDAQQPQLPRDQLAQRHIGLYAYRVALLHEFVQWPVAALEAAEKLEQLRILANGRRIHVAPACVPVPGGVDTPADLERLRVQLAAV